MPEIWYLKVTTWEGVLGYAKHHYGRIERDQPRTLGTCSECRWGNCHSPSCSKYVKAVEVWGEMTAEEAAATNADDGYSSYSAGDLTLRFGSRDALVSAAIATWEAQQRQEGDILVEGESGLIEPQRPIAGPADALAPLQELWDRFQPLHDKSGNVWTDADSDALTSFGNEWRELTKVFGVEAES